MGTPFTSQDIMIKAVTFDVWNTLLKVDLMFDNISRFISEIANISQREVEKALSLSKKKAKDLRYCGKLPAKEAVSICQSILAEYLNTDIDIVKRAVAKAVLAVGEEVVLPEVLETVRFLKEKGYKIACIGNVQFWPSAYTRIFMERYGLSNYIDKHFFSDEVGAFKPDPEIFNQAISFFKINPQKILHVGDKEKEDYQGAIKAGFKALLINPYFSFKKQVLSTLELD